MAARVLLVEPKAPSCEALARGVEELPGVQVHCVGGVDEALTSPELGAADVLVMNLDAPAEVVDRLLARAGADATCMPIVLLYDGASVAEKGPHLDPPGLRRLLGRVLDRTGPSRARRTPSSPPPFSLDEYLQLAGFGRHNVCVTVEPEGGSGGEILVWEGDVACARDGLGRGPEAFRRLAGAALMASTRVSCESLMKRPIRRDLPPGAWQALLFDVAREHDEGQPLAEAGGGRSAEVIPMPGLEISSLDAGSEGLDFDALVEAGVDALLSKAYARALAMFEAAERLMPGSPFVRGNIQRLRQMLPPRG